MPKKFSSCLKKVREGKYNEYKGKYNEYAICRVSTGFYGSTHHKKHRKLKGGI